MISNKEGVAATTPKRNGDGYLHFEGDYNITGKHSPTKGLFFDVETIEIDYGKIIAETTEGVLGALDAREQEAKAKKAEVEAHVKAALEAQEEKHQEELKKVAVKKGAPAFNQRVGKQSKSAGADEFLHWMKTGDNGSERVLKWDPMLDEDGQPYDEAGGQKALQVGADTEGGYLAPEDFYGQIIAKRDQMSWVRNAGINFMQTKRKNMQVPVISTKMSKFEVTAEEGSYSDSDPIFGEVDITVHKFTRMNKFSEELLSDEDANLEQFYAAELGRAWARTESYYVAIGTGSSQPQGVFVGGTAGLTFDSADQITADEIPELFGKLGNGYRRDAVWLMHEDTEAYLRKIRDANDFAFDMRGQNLSINGDWKYETFYGGRPIYTESGVSTIATAVKTVLIGNFEFYGYVEHTGLAVARNDSLYMATGQVGFFSKVRWGGAVLQAEAFQYATQA